MFLRWLVESSQERNTQFVTVYFPYASILVMNHVNRWKQMNDLVPRLSFDEGHFWNKYSFTNTPLFVDGVLGEPGEETLIMT